MAASGRARTPAGAALFDLTVGARLVCRRPTGELGFLAGRLPSGFHHRGATQLVPSGATLLQAGDTMKVFGGPEAGERLVDRLAAPTDPEPP